MLFFVAVASTSSLVVSQFDILSPDVSLLHLVTHRSTGELYIGAVNHLYVLNDDLSVHSSPVITGPHLDHYMCIPKDSCRELPQPWPEDCTVNVQCFDDYTTVMIDAVSKALLIDYQDDTLITCSNLFWGRCEKRILNNLSRITFAKSPVVSNDLMSPALMFTGPGPTKAEVLYVGVTCSSVTMERYFDLIGHMSSLSIASFDYTFYSPTSYKSTITMDNTRKTNILFRYGFSSGGFSYFATVRNDTMYTSHLSRVCQNDTKFSSYAEIQLKCKHEAKAYTVLQAAYVTHPGTKLAIHLGLPHVGPFNHHSDVLFGVFGTSDAAQANTANDSVLCVYTLSQIRRSFTEAIQECFSGIGNIGPPEFTMPQSCTQTVSTYMNPFYYWRFHWLGILLFIISYLYYTNNLIL